MVRRVMKRDKLDALFSNLIRESYNWTCCKCGKYFPEGQRQGLHASHIFSRRHQLLRHHPDNVVAHCYTCHQWYGSNPVLGGAWATAFLGQGVIEMLTERMRERRKYTKADKEEAYKHYKQEDERVKKLRMAGEIGHIEIIPFD